MNIKKLIADHHVQKPSSPHVASGDPYCRRFSVLGSGSKQTGMTFVKSFARGYPVCFILIFLSVFPALAGQAQPEIPEIPAEMVARKPKTANIKLRLSPESVMAMIKQGDVVLVDVRRKEDFEALSIPNSLNMPLYLIKTKAYLKTRPVVLVNEGYACSQLEQECERLQVAGFAKTYILDGGLLGWRQAGGELAGDPFAEKDLAMVAPRIFFLERHYDNRIVLNASTKDNKLAGKLVPEAVPAKLSEDDTAIIQQIKELSATTGNGAIRPSVLVFNEEGSYDDLDRKLKAAKLEVYYLQGGLKAYQTFLENQISMRHPGAIEIKKPCPTCP